MASHQLLCQPLKLMIEIAMFSILQIYIRDAAHVLWQRIRMICDTSIFVICN